MVDGNKTHPDLSIISTRPVKDFHISRWIVSRFLKRSLSAQKVWSACFWTAFSNLFGQETNIKHGINLLCFMLFCFVFCIARCWNYKSDFCVSHLWAQLATITSISVTLTPCTSQRGWLAHVCPPITPLHPHIPALSSIYTPTRHMLPEQNLTQHTAWFSHQASLQHFMIRETEGGVQDHL